MLYPTYSANKSLNGEQQSYTTTEKDQLDLVYAFEKFRAYLKGTKVIVHTKHATLRYLGAKKDAKPRLIRWVLLLQEFNFYVKNRKDCEHKVVNHLSKLETAKKQHSEHEIDHTFPNELVFSHHELPP